ncbi:hypothetical protein NEOLEDRAFT_1164429 [Neolentinus lepideus HHB14362 ss-1]|uniref:Thioesterase/thiol ester dehydrase-isomerase n=1 Tax=Neolentinus lepideus HHB14362 ss-1 TaxID=1314782 RepID=A0A165Q3X0_9AGAM|nr:hypothetical protein NEOLEDRAFT_1164429 [Neolentinus lepideus HHB14362 ss-1]
MGNCPPDIRLKSRLRGLLQVLRKVEHLVPTTAWLRALIPTTLKGIFWILILLNIRSFPLSWHFRVFTPVISLRLRYLLMKLKLCLKSKKVKTEEMDRWYASIAPLGEDPFRITTTYSSWAGPDDCDFNLHLSNSCYPKILDAARFQAALAMFPNLFPCGSWIALAGTHHHFIREIPIFSSYEVRMNLGSWDHKWIYIITRFVTHPKNKDKSKAKKAIENGTSVTSHLGPTIHTPATPLSNSEPATPANPVNPDPSTADSSSTVNETVKQLKQAQILKDEPDGATLHCVVVNQVCVKHGRITIPPAIAIGTNGMCGPVPSKHALGEAKKEERFSHANPPPYWPVVSELTKLSNQKAMREFLRGGWREVPEGERWWEEALGGDIERRRKERLEVLNLIRQGIDGARELE